MKEESKAIQEVAKMAGKVVDTSREFGGFIARFISGPLEQGIGIFEDKLKYARWERQTRLMSRAMEFLRQSGLAMPTRPVPLKIAIPLFQGAILEDNDDLQDKWAVLLVNAANANFDMEIRRSFLGILEQLTPLEVQILDILYSLPFTKTQHQGILTADLPNLVKIHIEGQDNFSEPNEEIALALGNLARLGCIRPAMTWGGGEIFGKVNPTILGRSFVHACHLPNVK